MFVLSCLRFSQGFRDLLETYVVDWSYSNARFAAKTADFGIDLLNWTARPTPKLVLAGLACAYLNADKGLTSSFAGMVAAVVKECRLKEKKYDNWSQASPCLCLNHRRPQMQ